VTPSRRRPVVSYWHDVYRVSGRRACRVARMAISTFRYKSVQEPRTALRLRIREIAQTRVRYGYRKIRVLLNREGWKVGKKLVYRLYREEGLTLRHKPRRKRRAAMHRRERFRPTAPNQVWGLDFVADQLADGRRFRALTVLDVFTRESLAIEVGQGLKGEDVVGALNQIRQKRGTPKLLFCDNGSEFTSQIMDLWRITTASRSTSRGQENRLTTLQRNLARGVFGCALVRDTDRGQASHRVLEAGIQ
jgi:putative transposase